MIDRQRSWSGRDEAEREGAVWVHWFITDRRHSASGYHPSVEFEDAHYRDTTAAPILEVA